MNDEACWSYYPKAPPVEFAALEQLKARAERAEAQLAEIRRILGMAGEWKVGCACAARFGAIAQAIATAPAEPQRSSRTGRELALSDASSGELLPGIRLCTEEQLQAEFILKGWLSPELAAKARALLRWLDMRGGLGHDVHARIRETHALLGPVKP